MLPVLRRAAEGETRVADVAERIAHDLGLTPEERDEFPPQLHPLPQLLPHIVQIPHLLRVDAAAAPAAASPRNP